MIMTHFQKIRFNICVKQGTDNENSPAEPANKGHILIADDDLVSQRVIRMLLENAGYRVEAVADGKAAISVMESRSFDMVFMDCMMPVMDGFEATRAIRSSDAGDIDPSVPVVALTGLTTSDDREKCFVAGMNDYLSKPVDPARLNAMTNRFMEKSAGTPDAGVQTGDKKETSGPGSETTSLDAGPTWDDDILDRLVASFLHEVPQTIADLNRALAKGDIVGLTAIGHRLRGAAEVIGFSTISNLSFAVEKAGTRADIKLATRLVPGLIKEMDNLVSFLTDPT